MHQKKQDIQTINQLMNIESEIRRQQTVIEEERVSEQLFEKRRGYRAMARHEAQESTVEKLSSM